MFWIAILVFSMSWMLIKLGFLSATAGVLIFGIKLLVLMIIAGLIAIVWLWTRGKAGGSA